MRQRRHKVNGKGPDMDLSFSEAKTAIGNVDRRGDRRQTDLAGDAECY